MAFKSVISIKDDPYLSSRIFVVHNEKKIINAISYDTKYKMVLTSGREIIYEGETNEKQDTSIQQPHFIQNSYLAFK